MDRFLMLLIFTAILTVSLIVYFSYLMFAKKENFEDMGCSCPGYNYCKCDSCRKKNVEVY